MEMAILMLLVTGLVLGFWFAYRRNRAAGVGPRAASARRSSVRPASAEGPDRHTDDSGTGKRRALTQDLAARIPLRVLLAEDTEVNQMLITRIFAKMGYAIDVAENGMEAVERARDNQYDLILMDIHMPELDGIEACKRILAEASESRPVIIAVTAHADAENRTRCLDAGMSDFIPKPFTLEILEQTVSRWGAPTLESP